jgi:hypothetical protein
MQKYSIEDAKREIAEHFGYGVEGTTSQYAYEKGANKTTNYRKDKHDRFCKRCFNHNGCCVNTGTKRKDSNCNV